MAGDNKDTPIDNKYKMSVLKKILRESSLEFVISRVEGGIAHINIYVGDD